MRTNRRITRMFRLQILQLICVMGVVGLSVLSCDGGLITEDIRGSLGIYRISIGDFSYGNVGNALPDFSVDVVTEDKTMFEIKIPVGTDFSNLTVTLSLSSEMEVSYLDESGEERKIFGEETTLRGNVFAVSETRPVEIRVRGGNVDKTYKISIIREGDANAIPIYTEANFALVRQNLNASYILKNDIVLTKEFAPIGTFSGTFDGGNKTISSLVIAAPANTDDIGMFAIIRGNGTVRNLQVMVLDGTKIRGSGDVGILAGESYGRIENVRVVGAVYLQGMGQQQSAGGLVGQSGGSGSITGGYARVDVEGEGNYVGGLVGRTTSSIKQSYATGGISGRDYVGGLVGQTTSSIEQSYATGKVKGSGMRVGGLVGNNDGGSISTSYFDAITTKQRQGVGMDNTNSIVTPYYTVNNAVRVQNGATTDEVTQANAFGHGTNNRWDFGVAGIWHWEGNGRWPTLAWQHRP